jgi:hypothetical protein
MNRTLILLPAVALVLLTAIVWCWMYYTRITEIRRRRISVQDLAQAVEAKRLLKDVADPSDNLVNAPTSARSRFNHEAKQPFEDSPRENPFEHHA